MFVVNSHRSVADSCVKAVSAASAPLTHTTHGLHTHCKLSRPMCEPGIKGHLIYSSQNQACAVCKLLHDCKTKNALNDQILRRDKYVFFKKCLKSPLTGCLLCFQFKTSQI